MSIRVRCAPSPTGYLHLGVARTALFNFLHARHEGGKFLLRIEDTDRERSREEYTRSILDGLEWLGLSLDEPPLIQSSRLEDHKQLLLKLVQEGKAYYCDCSLVELEALREDQIKRCETPHYDGRNRDRTDIPAEGSVIRLKTPGEGKITVEDGIYGSIDYHLSEVDDFIIAKRDGSPTYHFAVVADDHHQGITLVLRGNDLMVSTPKQILIYEALGWEPPRFAHLPMIHGKDKQKLSKRHGATAVPAYRALGYLPPAVCNYLVRLGWSHGDQEVFTMGKMIEKFSLDSIGKSPAVFDPDKMTWLNGEHIRLLPVPELADAWIEHLIHLEEDKVYLERGVDIISPSLGMIAKLEYLKNPENRPWVEDLVESFQVRSDTLVQISDNARPFFDEVIEYDPKAVQKVLKSAAREPLAAVRGWLASLESLQDEEAVHAGLESLSEKLDLKLGKVAQPLRVAITGRTFSPPINTTLRLMENTVGKEGLINRVDKALELIPNE